VTIATGMRLPFSAHGTMKPRRAEPLINTLIGDPAGAGPKSEFVHKC